MAHCGVKVSHQYYNKSFCCNLTISSCTPSNCFSILHLHSLWIYARYSNSQPFSSLISTHTTPSAWDASGNTFRSISLPLALNVLLQLESTLSLILMIYMFASRMNCPTFASCIVAGINPIQQLWLYSDLLISWKGHHPCMHVPTVCLHLLLPKQASRREGDSSLDSLGLAKSPRIQFILLIRLIRSLRNL